MKVLLENCEDIPLEGKLAKSKKIIEELRGDEAIDDTISLHLKRLWRDEAIQLTYECRSNFQLNDSASYFFERLDEVASFCEFE